MHSWVRRLFWLRGDKHPFTSSNEWPNFGEAYNLVAGYRAVVLVERSHRQRLGTRHARARWGMGGHRSFQQFSHPTRAR